MTYLRHLLNLLKSELEQLIALSLPLIAQRSLAKGLQQIWLKGDWSTLPQGAFVLASNHHSWWDLYLLLCVRSKLGRSFSGMMHEDTLERFPFFRQQGALSRLELREALRRLQQDGILHLFPEGEMQQAGQVKGVHKGMAYLVQKTSAPVYPLAIHVVMRGAEKPEAFLVLGEAIEVGGSSETLSANFVKTINTLLLELDKLILETPPEEAVAGFEPWYKKRQRFDEQIAKLGRLWQR